MDKVVRTISSYNREQNSKFMKFCFWCITVDIIFLPYLPFAAVSASVAVVAIWLAVKRKRVIKDREKMYFLIMAIFMIASTFMNPLYSEILRSDTSFSTAIKRCIQYFICFESYYFYKTFFKDYKVELARIIFVAVIYIASLALLFQFFPDRYAAVKLLITPADNHTRRYLGGLIAYRFNYLWTDPNNVSYLITGVCSWFLLQDPISSIKKMIVLALSTYIVFLTASNGGLFIFIFMCFTVFIVLLKKVINHGMRINTFITLSFGIIFAISLILFSGIIQQIISNYLSVFAERLGYYAMDKSGGRLDDLLNGLKLLPPTVLLLGTGHECFVTEIGHIYWIGMYGVPAYCIFIWLMFRKEKGQKWFDYIWTIPFFVAFTMNIAIGEYKWMSIYLMILAYSRYSIENKESSMMFTL